MSEINTDIVGKVIEGYKVVKPLGQGKFSTVYQAERQIDQKLVALKIIKIFDMMDQKQREKCLQESVDHPNIVKYLDSFICENELYIAIEWADKGDLKRLIKLYNQEGDKIDEIKIVDYTRQLAKALNHMHEKRIIHRDLKPANILMFSDGNLKLGDLGLGRYMSDETFKAFSKVGTPLYMSPEVIRNDGYDFKSDVWSLGCVIYELMTFRSPFRTDERISLFDLFNKINRGDYPRINDEKYSSVVKDLVESMLKVNPEERVSLDDIIKNCDLILKQQQEKPKIDPFIVMEDICEKLRLIDYENTFCKKYKKEIINKFYFAAQSSSPQFANFYELSYWLMLLIKQKVKLELIQEYDIKFKKFDKKRSVEGQLADLLNDLKQMEIKINENSKFQQGYGEGVCVIITQLLDKYLISQNFIFKKPKILDNLNDQKIEEIQNEFEEVVLEDNLNREEKNMTNTQFSYTTMNNFNTNFYFNKNNSAKNGGKKRWNSAMSNLTQETNANSGFTTETENFKIKPSHVIMESNIDPQDWRNELDRVEKLLEVQEYPEFLISASEESHNLNHFNNPNLNNLLHDDIDIVTKFSCFSNYFEKILKNNNISVLKHTHESIEQELKKINVFEKVISNSFQMKDKIDSIQKNYKIIKENEASINKMTDDFFVMQSKLEDIEENLRIQNEKEENYKNEGDATKNKNKIRNKIEQLKQEMQLIETKNSLFQSNIWQYYQILAKEKNSQNNQNYASNGSNEEMFDGIL